MYACVYLCMYVYMYVYDVRRINIFEYNYDETY